VVISDMRATTQAVHALAFNVAGTVPGPILVGMLSDRWAGVAGERSLGWALAAVGAIGFLAAAAYWIASLSHDRDVEAADAEHAAVTPA
jgi:energy-converting hydrogenase Eha subunit G